MKFNTMLPLCLAAFLTFSALAAVAQDAGPDEVSPEPATDAPAVAPAAAPEAPELTWGDYTVKAYTLTIWGGNFSGATYLENKELSDRTILEDGAGHIVAYNGGVLEESTKRYEAFYDAASKEIKSGNAFGARIGVYITDDFHLDLMGSYASGEAVTTMLYTEDPVLAPDRKERIEVDSDPGFKVYRGGLALMYNAHPAEFFGIVPRLGFGLGGIINRFSVLEDKTGLYLEANFGLNYEIVDNLELAAQVDLTNFAFDVDELGYSQMINYTTFSLGLSWYIDRVPAPVRAAHIASRN